MNAQHAQFKKVTCKSIPRNRSYLANGSPAYIHQVMKFPGTLCSIWGPLCMPFVADCIGWLHYVTVMMSYALPCICGAMHGKRQQRWAVQWQQNRSCCCNHGVGGRIYPASPQMMVALTILSQTTKGSISLPEHRWWKQGGGGGGGVTPPFCYLGYITVIIT